MEELSLEEKEKKAIEEFKKLKDYKQTYYGYNWFTLEVCADDEMKQNIDIILNIIEKQSKEIEELKEERKKYPIAMNDEQYKKVIELAQKDIKEELDRQINARIVNEEFIENNFISKDKIKAKIEELEAMSISQEIYYEDILKILQSLLEKE